MAEQILESNIIIKTKVERPNREGFRLIHSSIDSINKKLTKLTTTPWVIKLAIDDSDLKRYKLQAAAGGGVSSGKPPGSLGTGSVGGIPGGAAGAGILSRRTTETSENVVLEEKRRKILNEQQVTETKITDAAGERNKNILEELSLKEKVLTADKRRRVEDNLRTREAQRQAKLAEEGRQLGRVARQSVTLGQFPPTMESGGGSRIGSMFEQIAAAEREGVARRKVLLAEAAKTHREEVQLAQKRDAIIAAGHKKTTIQQIDTERKLKAQAAQQELRMLQARDAQAAAAHKRSVLKQVDEDRKLRQQALFAPISNQRREDERMSREAEAQARQRRAREYREAAAEQKRQAKQVGVEGVVQDALGRGFVERPDTRVFDAATGQMQRTRNLVRQTGNAFTGYTVEVLRANEATGKITSELLTGARAMKFLGDSVINAASKVALWTIATMLIFGTVLAFRTAAQEIAKLEEGTILLARVGQQFGADNSNFEERLEISKRLTDQIIELTTVYGGSAAEAQQAAAIFARAQLDEQEVLQGTRAALIASRIAELGLVDSARLLTAAMLQFNLEAGDLMPTLDSLNTLSNNYRVSTNDLLQAISRTGAVYAEHGGQLESLAAVTAVVGQRTGRTGAEIGNALKTISSNLDRIDIQQSLFEKLGISTVNFAGDSKSLGTVIQELRNNMDQLSDSEQKQLTLQIAGIRQRNILLAAIRTADESIVAENKALLDSGSATDEARQSAKSLTQALGRLQATLLQIAQQGSGPLLQVANRLLNLIDYILRFATYMDGLPAKILISVWAFLLLQRGVAALSAWFTTLRATISTAMMAARVQTVAIIQNAAAHQAGTTAVARHVVAQRALVGVLSSGAGVLRAAAGSGGLLTLALVASVLVMGTAAEASNTYTASVANATDALNQTISAEDRRRQSISNTVTAVARLVRQYDQLTAAGKKQQAEEVRRRGIEIAKSGGIDLSTGNFSIEEAVAQAREQEIKSIERQRDALEKLRTAKSLERAEARKAYQELVQQQAAIESGGPLNLTKQGQAIPRVPGGLVKSLLTNSYDPIRNIESDILADLSAKQAEAFAAAKKSGEEYAALQEEINALKQEEFDLGEKAVKLDQLRVALIKDQTTAENRVDTEKTRSFADSLDETGSADRLVKSYADIAAESQLAVKNLKDMAELTKGMGTDLLEADFKRVNDTLEEQAKILQEVVALGRVIGKDFVSGALGTRNDLLGRAGGIAQEKSRRLGNESPFGDEVARIDLQRSQQVDRLLAVQRASAELDKNDAGWSKGRGLGATAALDEERQAALTRLKELEADKAIAILEAEKEIAIERKKSADEAARALGTLSEEDKLRVRATAAFFAKDPTRKLSFEEQFNTDAASNRILQSFFGGRLESGSDTKSAFASGLAKGGFGSTTELEKGEAEIKAARRGRTDAELLRQAQAEAIQIQEQLGVGAGKTGGLGAFSKDAFGIGPGRGTDAGGAVTGAIPIDIRGDAFNFQPLADAVREGLGEMFDAKIAVVVEELRSIIEENRALKLLHKPRRTVGPAGE